MYDMDTIDVKSAVAEIEATTDLLERALKLTGGTCGFACFDGNASQRYLPTVVSFQKGETS